MNLVACGSMSDFDRPQTPPAPAQPPVETAAEEPVATDFEDTDPAALTDFKEPLEGHGDWVQDPTYGHVWVPSRERVGEDFAPYVTSGHWALDANDEWLWVSDYDDTFGWVVFHYGRWVWVSGNGWVWVPGRRYAPAWVVWRAGDPGYGYVGWAPMPPAYYWGAGYSVVWLSSYPTAPYVFCSTTYVFAPHVHTHIVTGPQVATVAGPTRVYGQPTPGGPGRVLSAPSRGPTASSGIVPTSAWPSSHHAIAPDRVRYATPQGMGRAAPPSSFARQTQGGSPVRAPRGSSEPVRRGPCPAAWRSAPDRGRWRGGWRARRWWARCRCW
ncbi:MAG: hypothetical protein EOO75_09255, partial [Myxococcales bacterium]